MLLFGIGISLHRRAADEYAHELHPGPLLRPRLGDQQLDLEGRAAAAGGTHLRRDECDVLLPLGALAPGLTLDDPAVRVAFPPLNAPRPGAAAGVVAPPTSAPRSRRSAWRMLVAAGLLVVGSAISWFGLRDGNAARPPEAPRPPPRRLSALGMPRDWDARTYDRVADPMARWGADGARPPARCDGDERVLDAGAAAAVSPNCSRSDCPTAVSSRWMDRLRWSTRRDERLAPFGDRSTYVVADLGQPLPLDRPVDAVLSTATFHWVPDHDGAVRRAGSGHAAGRPAGRPVRRGRRISRRSSACWPARRRLARAGPFRDAAGHDRSPRRDRLGRHRLLADRRADQLRGRRTIRDLPANRGPGCAPGARPAEDHDAFVRPWPTGRRTGHRLRPAQHRGHAGPGQGAAISIALISRVGAPAARRPERAGHDDVAPGRLGEVRFRRAIERRQGVRRHRPDQSHVRRRTAADRTRGPRRTARRSRPGEEVAA